MRNPFYLLNQYTVLNFFYGKKSQSIMKYFLLGVAIYFSGQIVRAIIN